MFSYKMLFFNIVTTISCAFSPATNNSLHAALVEIHVAAQNVAGLSRHHHHCWNAPPITFLCTHPLFDLHKHSASVSECQWVPFFPCGGIWWHTVASYTLPCQLPFFQTAPLLPSVTQQQNRTEYGWEDPSSTAISPTSASDVVNQHNETWGVTFGAVLIQVTRKMKKQ